MKTIDDLNLSEPDKRAIEEASRMLKTRFPVEKVILWGSKARGERDPESDIDLLLLTFRPIDWKERNLIIDALFDVEMAYDVVISILDATVSEWENGIFTLFPIHKEILRDGAIAA